MKENNQTSNTIINITSNQEQSSCPGSLLRWTRRVSQQSNLTSRRSDHRESLNAQSGKLMRNIESKCSLQTRRCLNCPSNLLKHPPLVINNVSSHLHHGFKDNSIYFLQIRIHLEKELNVIFKGFWGFGEIGRAHV